MVNKNYLTGRQDNQCGGLMLVSIVLLATIYKNENQNYALYNFMRNHFVLNSSLIVLGLCIVTILLNIFNKPKIDVSNYKKSILESVNIRPTIFGRIMVYLICTFAFLVVLIATISSCSILVLIVWGYLFCYYLFFHRFIVFMLDEKFHTSKRFKGKALFKFIKKYLKMGAAINLEPGDTYMLFKRVKE